ncbi:hypothetical protein [Nitratireductor sp. ZSWI3]|uniref:hypothetical protein n=1 Tax=Nitratireductor sp. ZSWI3 TaxID=2966359 RepID=UPI00214FDCAE|nr:hypothetical protein [Nitratireductor sp. ZSWI3]MCR4267764.1 hypothetical protein [Nitratireductor sp. ZSWI3]
MIKSIAVAGLLGAATLLLSGCVYEEGYAHGPYYDGVYAGGVLYSRDRYHDRDYRHREWRRHRHRDADRYGRHISRDAAAFERRLRARGHRFRIIPTAPDDRH